MAYQWPLTMSLGIHIIYVCVCVWWRYYESHVDYGWLQFAIPMRYLGASTSKYWTPSHCIVLRESDSKLYTDFEFCEGKNHKYLKNTLIYKANQFILIKKIEDSLHILENNASGVQVDILNTWSSSNCLKRDKITLNECSNKCLWWCLKFTMNLGNI